MKIVIATLLLFFTFVAHAQDTNITVLCKRDSNSSCADRTVAAFEKLNCNPLATSVQCQDAMTDVSLDPEEAESVQGKDFCTIQSNCSEPHEGNFGRLSCAQNKQLFELNAPGITLATYYYSYNIPLSFLKTYVTQICK